MAEKKTVEIKLDRTCIIEGETVRQGSKVPVDANTAALLCGIGKAHVAKEGEKHEPVKEPATGKGGEAGK